jgi:hypothetical protein
MSDAPGIEELIELHGRGTHHRDTEDTEKRTLLSTDDTDWHR